VLADPAGEQWPFERAQIRLDYGEWLRRRPDSLAGLTPQQRQIVRLAAAGLTNREIGDVIAPDDA
jgi:DNA-binding NarL/FixJ family response regulator